MTSSTQIFLLFIESVEIVQWQIVFLVYPTEIEQSTCKTNVDEIHRMLLRIKSHVRKIQKMVSIFIYILMARRSVKRFYMYTGSILNTTID